MAASFGSLDFGVLVVNIIFSRPTLVKNRNGPACRRPPRCAIIAPQITGADAPEEKGNRAMKDTYTRLTRSGAQALTLGILTLIFGVTTGVLGIVNGGKLLHESKKLR